MEDDEMVEVTRSLQKYYKNYAIYMKPAHGHGYVLYKPKGVPIEAIRIQEGRHPKNLYISLQDKVKEIASFQRKYNAQLKKLIHGDPVEAKNILHKTMELSFSEPRTNVLQNVKETVEIVIHEYLQNPSIVRSLLEVSTKDYSTSIHSINVMLFCLGYAYYNRLDMEEIKRFGLMGLLHDVGIVAVPDDIVKANHELNVRETKIYKQHSEHGYRILMESGYEASIALAALEHHERLDGTGYPDGKRGNELQFESKGIAIVDTFEFMTSLRPGHEPIKPIVALASIMEEVEKGKLDREIFKRFAHSIVGMQ